MLKDTIKELSQNIHSEVVGFRRHLHQHPELSFEEHETAAFIQSHLAKWGIEMQTNVGGLGVVGFIYGKKGAGKTIALRADIDALPILEKNNVPYKSQNEGVMHACGHDVHTSSLLGVAYTLMQLREHFAGTIKLIFQPAEERVPGGASLMIKDGVLKNPDVESIIGQHVAPNIDCGKIGLRAGRYMASADEIYLTIKGKGGHGAQPQNCIDPIIIAANTLVQLQTVISRNADPRSPSLLTFGKIEGGTATNVIPNEVKLEGTFRAMNEKWRAEGLDRITKIVNAVAESMGGEAHLDIRKGYPVLYNDEKLTARTHSAICEYMGEENVIDLDLWMASEDFAYYTHEIPGCFYRLGTANRAQNITSGVHTDTFDIDEKALEISVGLMTWLAIRELENFSA